jgi:hypothetical protein
MAGLGATPSPSVVRNDIRQPPEPDAPWSLRLMPGRIVLGHPSWTSAARGDYWAAVGRTRIDPDGFDHDARDHIRKRARHSKTDLNSFFDTSCRVIDTPSKGSIAMPASKQPAGAHGISASMCARPSDRNTSLRIGSLCLDVRLVSQMLRPCPHCCRTRM